MLLALAFQLRYRAVVPFKSLDDVPDEMQNRHPGSRWVIWRPTPRGPRWLVRLDFGKTQRGELAECIGLEIRSFRESDDAWPDFLPKFDEGPVQLQRRTLRDLPLGQMLDDLGEEILQIWTWWAESFRQPIGDADDDAAAAADAEAIDRFVADQRARKGKRQGRGIPDLAAIAAVYKDAMRRRESTTAAVAQWGTVSESTAAKWIMRVRRETDLLPPPTNRPQKRGRQQKGT